MSDTTKETATAKPAAARPGANEPAAPKPELIPLEGDGLVCDIETGVCSSPALTPERTKTDR
ncbi:MAG: hypothetical protein JWN15_4051 [Firmicutes bacterium]|nr:hypothetical protein [Bacillota bacterium]